MNTVSYFLCPYTNFITIIVVSRRSHHPYVININGLMWDCYINTALVTALDELLSICGHAYSLDLGRIACTQAHSRITDIAIAGLRLWQDPVTNDWSRNACECVALPIWICIIFNGIIIVTICIIIPIEGPISIFLLQYPSLLQNTCVYVCMLYILMYLWQ